MEGLEQQAGLIPVSVEFESTDHSTLISLPLNGGTSAGSTGHQDPINRTTLHEDSDDNLTEGILYLLMKNNVSIQFYHDLSMLLGDIPRSYKVAI